MDLLWRRADVATNSLSALFLSNERKNHNREFSMKMTHFRRRLMIVVAIVSVAAFSEVAAGDDAEDAQRACSVIDSMGSSVKCAVEESEHAIDLTADTSAVDAMQLCTSFAGMVAAMTQTLSAHWKFRVFSDQDSDVPAAVCDLG